MSRSTSMSELLRIARLAETCARTGADSATALGDGPRDPGRRRLIRGSVAGASILAAGAVAPQALASVQDLGKTAYRALAGIEGVAIVGGGLAGLACATELARLGIDARVYEARTRVGGRCWTLRGLFPGQVAEQGAEFISSAHHSVIGFARGLGLELEAISRRPSMPLAGTGGRRYSEVEVLDEYRAFAECIRPDLEALGSPTADSHVEAAFNFDFMSLEDYMTLYGAGDLLRNVISAACAAEFGVDPEELSAIAFLRFVHGDIRTKLGGAGPMPGEQLHVVGGNDQIATGLAARLPRPVELDHRLVAMSRGRGGAVRLTFETGGRFVDAYHEAVVLALPFSVLRHVDIDASVDLPDWKRLAIQQFGSGDASKLSIGFRRPYWLRDGAEGAASMPALQNVWETDPSGRAANRAVLAYQAGGAAARMMRQETLDGDAGRVLQSLELTLPGAAESVRRDARGQIVASLHNWSMDTESLGAFAAPRPGYFTTIANLEAKPVENLVFAGDHTSSFYEWQGFMEGAVLSGLRAAAEVRALAA